MTDNYVFFYLGIIMSIGLIGITIATVSEEFFGYPQFKECGCKTEEERKRRTNFMRGMSAIVMVITVVAGIVIWWPGFCDLPQAAAGKYTVKEGTVTKIYGELEEGYLIKATVDVKDKETEKIEEFSDIYTPYLEEGCEVKIASLDHSNYGSFIEVDGEKWTCTPRKGTGFVILILLGNTIATIGYFFWHLEGRSKKKRKTVKIYVYQNVMSYLGRILGVIVCIEDIIMVAALCGYYSNIISKLWSVLILINIVFIVVNSILSQQNIKMESEEFYYCKWKNKMTGSIKDIEKIYIREQELVIVYKKQELIFRSKVNKIEELEKNDCIL